ncbi:FG-GAP-like repeat-containing protein [Phreatobacter stygius]|nr:FG-GAP-like repeat-containing protein [Phreatobacter stygius]
MRYATARGLALAPQMEEGWRTYNFEVANDHTYVAEDLRVHNDSVFDYIPTNAVVLGWGGPENNPDRAVFIRGSEQIYYETRYDASGFKYIYQEARLLDAAPNPWVRPDGTIDEMGSAIWGGGVTTNPHGPAVITQTTPVGPTGGQPTDIRPDFQRIQSVQVDGVIVAAGNLGASLGASLGRAIAGDNKVAQFAAGTFFSAIGKTVGETLSGGLEKSILASGPNGTTLLDLGIDNAFAAFGYRVGQNLSTNIMPSAASALSAILMGELAEAVGLKGFEAKLFTTAGNAITTQFLTNIGNIATGTLYQGAAATLFDGFNSGAMIGQIGSSLASMLGSELGNAILPVHGPQSALFGSAVGALGAIAGTVLTTALTAITWGIPIIGPFIGALLGTLLGNWMGNQIYGNSASLYELTYDAAKQDFGERLIRNSNGPNIDLAKAMLETAEASIRSLLEETGGRIDPVTGMFRVGFGHFADQYMAYDVVASGATGGTPFVTNPGTYEIRVPDQLSAQQAFTKVVEHGTTRTFANTTIVGGDIVVQRAFYAWQALAKTENNWDYVAGAPGARATLTQLAFDLKIAKDFRYYLDNTALINYLIQADIKTLANGQTQVGEYAATWIATLMRARDLGLHNASKFDFIGGMSQILESRGLLEKAIAARPDFDGDMLLLVDPVTGATVGGMDNFFGPGRTARVDGTAGNDLIDLTTRFSDAETKVVADYALALKDSLLGASNAPITAQQFADLFSNPTYSVIRADGGAGDDIIRGTSGTDILVGGVGNDTLEGRDGQDWLFGDEGNDTLDGGRGDDFLSGGAGNDGLAGGEGNDFLAGGAGEDTLDGGAGGDVLAGGAGNDVYVISGAQVDTVRNALGNRNGDYDVVSYDTPYPWQFVTFGRSGTSVNVFSSLFAISGPSFIIEDFFGTGMIDRIDVVAGGSFTAAQIVQSMAYGGTVGDGQQQIFNPSDAGSQAIYGRGGSDILVFGQGCGADVFYAETGGSVPGPSAPFVTPGGGMIIYPDDIVMTRDRVVFMDGVSFRAAFTLTATSIAVGYDATTYLTIARGPALASNTTASQVELVFQDGMLIVTFGATGEIVSIISPGDEAWSRAHVYANGGNDLIAGTSGNDLIVGGTGNDLLRGIDGSDRLEGGAGDDTLIGGAGMDSLDGGDGIDTAAYNEALRGVVVSLTPQTGPQDLRNLNEATGDVFISIENVKGSKYADEISGDGNANLLEGLDGDDAILGGAGADILRGGNGNDVLDGGAGADVIDGGAGNDTASYSNSLIGLVVSLLNPALNTGDAFGDTFNSIEVLRGSDFDDILSGDDAANMINGGGGNDILSGGAGNDILIGGANSSGLSLAGKPAQQGQMGAEWTIVGSADFGGDGVADLAWTSGGNVALWTFGSGALSQFNYVDGHMGPEWTVVGTGDFNGDGKADIAWTTAGQVAIWQMNGATIQSFGVPAGQMGAEWKIAGIGDFNGDGKSDLFWRSDTCSIWFMNGLTLTSFTTPDGYMGAEWHVAAIGDFNGDGRDDLVWQDTGGTVAMWSMNGSHLSGFSANFGRMGAEWRLAGAGDFNRDGKDDLVWVSTSNAVQIWEMNGSQIAKFDALASQLDNTWRLQSVSDLNGDKVSDLLWADTSGKTAVWSFSSGGDIMTGGAGSDIFVFNALNETGKAITDFQVGAGGDVLQLHGLLAATGYAGADGLHDGVVKFLQSGADTLVQIDSNPTPNQDWVTAVRLQNVVATTITLDNIMT